MPLHEFYGAILFVLYMALVRSAPSLNKSPQSPVGQVILANSDLVSEDGTSRNSNLSQHLLNSTQINSEQELDTLLSVTTQSSVRSMESKLINLAKTNTSSASNFSLAVSRPFNSFHDLVTSFISRMLNTSFRNTAVHHPSMTPSPDLTTFRPEHTPTHHHLSSVNPSLYQFASPSRRIFLAFSRFFSNPVKKFD